MLCFKACVNSLGFHSPSANALQRAQKFCLCSPWKLPLTSHGTTKAFSARQLRKRVLDNPKIQKMAFLGYKVLKSKHTMKSTHLFFLPQQRNNRKHLPVFHICACSYIFFCSQNKCSIILYFVVFICFAQYTYFILWWHCYSLQACMFREMTQQAKTQIHWFSERT